MTAAPADYWNERAQRYATRGHGLAAVCSYGMPAFYNRYIDVCQRRALAPWLRMPARPGGATLDVGCGIGRWSVELARRGHDVTAVDLSPRMLERAETRAREAGVACRFEVGDAATLALGRTFDLILCVTVLQHIMEPAVAAAAIERLAAHVSPTGELVLLEAAPSLATARCDTASFRARTADWYAEALRRAGLELTARRGVDPMPLKTWLVPVYRHMPRPLGLTALALSTAISLPFDWAFGQAFARYSWHTVFRARHR